MKMMKWRRWRLGSWGDRVMESQFPAQSLLEKQPHLLGLAANLGKLGEAGCFFQAEKTQWYKFYNHGVFCFFLGGGFLWNYFLTLPKPLTSITSRKLSQVTTDEMLRTWPVIPIQTQSHGENLWKKSKCSALILGGWFSSLQKVHIKIGSTPCVSWEILILRPSQEKHELVFRSCIEAGENIPPLIYTYIYIYLCHQRKFGWETSELRTFKNAKNSVK